MSKRGWSAMLVVFCVWAASAAGMQSVTAGSVQVAHTGATVGNRLAAPSRRRAGLAGTIPAPCTWHAATSAYMLDTNSHYWYLVVRADPAISLTIQGAYPAARFASFEAYTTTAASIGGLFDRQFPPDPGSVNPFIAHTPRGTGAYTLHLAFTPAPAQPDPSTIYAAVPETTTTMLDYRLYLPDRSATITGNVDLPLVTAHNVSDGTPIDCPGPVLSVPWGTPQPSVAHGYFARYQTGLYPNPLTAYLAATLPLTNTLDVIRFRPPTSPATLDGQPITQTDQLRYWSLCLYTAKYMPYQAYAIRCVADENVPLDSNGWATIVVGPWWLQPSNATAANAVMWIPLAPSDLTVPFLAVVRQLLPNPTFMQSAFHVPYGWPATWIMGSYAPTVTFCSRQQFQTNFCHS